MGYNGFNGSPIGRAYVARLLIRFNLKVTKSRIDLNFETFFELTSMPLD